jgi:predicted ATPase
MNLIQRVVFAGGPGGGKSLALEILKQRGFDMAADSARSIIRALKAEGLPMRRPRIPRAFSSEVL